MKYTEMQLDGLKELINIGGGNAATSISKLINLPISMNVPEVVVLDYQTLYSQIMEEDKEVHAVISSITGGFSGVFLFVLSDAAAERLTHLVMDTVTEEIKQSVISELTNIVFNSFLNAISQLLSAELSASLPTAHYDFFGAAISSLYLALNQFDDQILVIRNEFSYETEILDASLFFIPEAGVLEEIFGTLGI
ncbi:chemotaxis protein CheC [Enterococcus sp.]|jgi:chemotaxis protein CheC|uniref:chemotaxis protein CheC n=1 Tax=Enterococcus sp. TaxID=35783 RepID=UPI0025B7D4EF|nr:chemotaxis protein CheC [Enterococcus sp.]